MDYEYKIGDKVFIKRFSDGDLTNYKITKEVTKVFASKAVELDGFGIYHPWQLELVKNHNNLSMDINIDMSDTLNRIEYLNRVVKNYKDLVEFIRMTKWAYDGSVLCDRIDIELEKYDKLNESVINNDGGI